MFVHPFTQETKNHNNIIQRVNLQFFFNCNPFCFQKSRRFVLPTTPLHPRFHGFCHPYSSDLPVRIWEMDMPDLMPVLNPSLYMELLLFLTMRIMGAVWFMSLTADNFIGLPIALSCSSCGRAAEITMVGLTCCLGMPPGERETEQVSGVVTVQTLLSSSSSPPPPSLSSSSSRSLSYDRSTVSSITSSPQSVI